MSIQTVQVRIVEGEFITKRGKKITIVDFADVKQFSFQEDVWKLIKEYLILTSSNVKFKCRLYDDVVTVVWRKKNDRFFLHENPVPTAKANYRWMTKARKHFGWEQMEKDDKIYFTTKQNTDHAVSVFKADATYFQGYIDYSGLVYYRHNFKVKEDVLLDCVYNDLLISTKSQRVKKLNAN
jgi:hypothetical protein